MEFVSAREGRVSENYCAIVLLSYGEFVYFAGSIIYI